MKKIWILGFVLLAVFAINFSRAKIASAKMYACKATNGWCCESSSDCASNKCYDSGTGFKTCHLSVVGPGSSGGLSGFSGVKDVTAASPRWDVWALQEFLAGQGLFNSPITGVWGVTTTDAVNSFQKGLGLPTLTGKFDQATRTQWEEQNGLKTAGPTGAVGTASFTFGFAAKLPADVNGFVLRFYSADGKQVGGAVPVNKGEFTVSSDGKTVTTNALSAPTTATGFTVQAKNVRGPGLESAKFTVPPLAAAPATGTGKPLLEYTKVAGIGNRANLFADSFLSLFTGKVPVATKLAPIVPDERVSSGFNGLTGRATELQATLKLAKAATTFSSAKTQINNLERIIINLINDLDLLRGSVGRFENRAAGGPGGEEDCNPPCKANEVCQYPIGGGNSKPSCVQKYIAPPTSSSGTGTSL